MTENVSEMSAIKHQNALVIDNQMLAILFNRAAREETGEIPISGSINLLYQHGFLKSDFITGNAEDLCTLLIKLAEANLPLARLYEGHANAILIASRYLPVSTFAPVAAGCNNGELYGVWGADGQTPVFIDQEKGCLRGQKQFASGLGSLSWAMVTAKDAKNLTELYLVPVSDKKRIDRSSWAMTGMIATSSGTYDFDGLPLDEVIPVGKPGMYEVEPHFVGGVWRIAAVQLGGIFGLLKSVTYVLSAKGQSASTEHNLRLFPILSRAIAAKSFLFEVAAMEQNSSADSDIDPEYIVANSILCRLLTEEIAMDATKTAEQSIGLSHFSKHSTSGRIARDLSVYCRQAARDAMLQRAATRLLYAGEEMSDALNV